MCPLSFLLTHLHILPLSLSLSLCVCVPLKVLAVAMADSDLTHVTAVQALPLSISPGHTAHLNLSFAVSLLPPGTYIHTYIHTYTCVYVHDSIFTSTRLLSSSQPQNIAVDNMFTSS